MLLTARSADQLEQLSAQLSSKGVSAASAAIDLTQSDGIAAAIAGLLQQGETPSVLINNAGAAYTGDLLAMPIERWQWLLQLNVTSGMQVCSAVVPAMRENGGLVINISSHAARNAFPQWGCLLYTSPSPRD